MVLTNENRRTLSERVQRRVAGRGISRRAVDDAVDRVARALAERLPSGTFTAASASEHRGIGCGCDSAAGSDLIAVLSSVVMPDLASRTRGALGARGIAWSAIGAASAGRH